MMAGKAANGFGYSGAKKAAAPIQRPEMSPLYSVNQRRDLLERQVGQDEIRLIQRRGCHAIGVAGLCRAPHPGKTHLVDGRQIGRLPGFCLRATRQNGDR